MKKLLVILLSIFAISSCKKQEATTDTVLVKIETEGMGQIAYALQGKQLKFNDKNPTSSASMNIAKGSKVTISAKKQYDEFEFVRWNMNGQLLTNDPETTITANCDIELVAVFALTNTWDGTGIANISEIQYISDVLSFYNHGYTTTENTFIYVFEIDDIIYRAIANLNSETSKQLSDLELNDPEYERKFKELVSPLQVVQVDIITNAIPSQDLLNKYVGKTGQDLLDEGFSSYDYNLDEMEFSMTFGWFSYIVKFDGQIENEESLDINEAIKDLKVLSIKYEGLADLSNLEYQGL